MDRVFRQREDWFEVGIVPAIRRRTIIGALLISLCIAAWLYWGSLAPFVVAAIVVAERVFEFTHVEKTKEIISSLSIQETKIGLAFSGLGIKGTVVYPWSSLSYNLVSRRGGEREAIIIKDLARNKSKQKLVGFEGMSELIALIEDNAKKS